MITINNSYRKVFKIPVGDLSPKEARKIINKYKKGNLEEEIRKLLMIDRQNKIDKILNKNDNSNIRWTY